MSQSFLFLVEITAFYRLFQLIKFKIMAPSSDISCGEAPKKTKTSSHFSESKFNSKVMMKLESKANH